MTAEQVMAMVRKSGQVCLGGEMAFPADEGADKAFKTACLIAEECGYLVTWQQRHATIEVSGGDIFGYYSLHWCAGENELDSVTHCVAYAAMRQP